MDERAAYATVTGKVIQRLRAGSMNQQQLAVVAGLSQSALSRFENGQSLPDTFEIRRLAVALGKRPSELIDLIEQAFACTEGHAKKISAGDPWSGIASVAVAGLALFGAASIIDELEKRKRRR
jgi:transcriptional regulator with XRE-family HTH domain